MSQLQQKQAWMMGGLTADLDGTANASALAAQGHNAQQVPPTANSSSTEGTGAVQVQSSAPMREGQGRAKAEEGQDDQPPSEAGCSNVLPLYQIPESATVQVILSMHAIMPRVSMFFGFFNSPVGALAVAFCGRNDT
eukprot:scaffold106817_cov42-Prasinocladus_malaysianus.AAC.1